MKRIATAGVALALFSACSDPAKPAAPAAIEFIASDYAFQAPATLPAGRTTFSFVNKGKVRHELNISRLKPGVSIDTLLQLVRADKTVRDVTEGSVGVLFAQPGQRSSAGLTVELSPGETYAVICIFRDSAGAKRHYDLGMYSAVRVEGSQTVTAPSPEVTDTITATDYAFQYSRKLAPGRHTFAMRNHGKVRHQLSIVLLKNGVTFQRMKEVEKARGDVEALFEGDFGLVYSRAMEQPLGQLTIDMLPGREYVIACFVQDDAKSPEHYALGMYGSIITSGAPAA